MKKILSCILVVCLLMFGSVGCSKKSEDVVNVEQLIDEIGTVDSDSLERIEAAEEAYNDLSKDDKEAVENYSELVAAREAYDSLLTLDNYDTYLSVSMTGSLEDRIDACTITGGSRTGQVFVYQGYCLGADVSAISSHYEFENVVITVHFTGQICPANFDAHTAEDLMALVEPIDFTLEIPLNIAGDGSESSSFNLDGDNFFMDNTGVQVSMEVVDVSGSFTR